MDAIWRAVTCGSPFCVCKKCLIHCHRPPNDLVNREYNLLTQLETSKIIEGPVVMQTSTKISSRNQAFVVIKVAEVCNLQCPYCYFFFGGDDSYRDDPAAMSIKTIEHIAHFLADGAKEVGLRRIDVSLHGGEPLMVGKRRFEAICNTLREVISPVCDLGINLQTNAVLIDREWVEIFARNNIGVGVSVDGDRITHDRNRVDRKGRGSYDKTIAGIRLLEEHAPVGILCVIQPDADGKSIYNHFIHELGLTSIDFLLPLQNWTNFDEDRTADVTKFYSDVLEAWLEDNRRDVQIRTLSDPLIAMLSDRGAQRRTQGLLDNCEAITIRSNGDLCPDDTLTSILPVLRRTGHNVGNSTLQKFMSDPLWAQLRPAAHDPIGECLGCQWWSICRGGHADHRYSPEMGFRRASTYCSTYKTIYPRIMDYVTRAVPREIVAARLEAIREVETV
jgi:uncharacterized protein